MDTETKKFEPLKPHMAAHFADVTATAENILDKGTEAYGKAGQVVGEAYDKTAQKVKKTFEKARSYSDENQGKTILVALGIGAGIGMLLRAGSSNRSRSGRIAQPVINAFSTIAHRFYR